MDKNNIKNVLSCISAELRTQLEKCSDSLWDTAEEIMMSVSKPVTIFYNGGIEYVNTGDGVFICSKKNIDETLSLISGNSMYAIMDKLAKGYITLKGGNRAGVAGTTVINDGEISAIRDISTISIRIRREIKGISNEILPHIRSEEGILNTLIISPPRCGKTTLLRDIARVLGNEKIGLAPIKPVIIDERGELASMHHGIPQNDIGVHTTVLDNCPKSLGIPLSIRSMAPTVIITDEIDADNDINAVNYAANSGVKIISTAHGSNIEELAQKKNFKDILPFFDVIITLTNIGGTGSIKSIRRYKEIAI